MCTLSFIPQENGYIVGMNRDEQISRSATLVPERFPIEGGYAIYPREPSGGTWIAANSFGVTLALLNWYSVPATAPKSQSRGEVIPALIAGEDSALVHDALTKLPLEGTLPFRLIGIFSQGHKVTEWRWSQRMLEIIEFPWERRHWFSSGLSDAQAEKNRGAVCSRSEPDGQGVSKWLRELHGSHENGPGPFSICVHRLDVRSLSYTQINYADDQLAFETLAESPCKTVGLSTP